MGQSDIRHSSYCDFTIVSSSLWKITEPRTFQSIHNVITSTYLQWNGKWTITHQLAIKWITERREERPSMRFIVTLWVFTLASNIFPVVSFNTAIDSLIRNNAHIDQWNWILFRHSSYRYTRGRSSRSVMISICLRTIAWGLEDKVVLLRGDCRVVTNNRQWTNASLMDFRNKWMRSWK